MRKHVAMAIVVIFAATVFATGAMADSQNTNIAVFDTQAQALLASAPVTYKGDLWGPVPLWTVDLVASINTTVDVAAYTADDARTDPGLLNIVARQLWENAGEPLAPAPLPAVAVATPPPAVVADPSVAASSPPDIIPATIPQSVTPDPSPSVPPLGVVPASPSLSGTVYAPIQIYVGAQAAKQPTVVATLTKALAEHVTLAPTVRLTVNGKTVALARIKALLAKKHSVKVTLKNSAKGLVVTRIAA